MALALVDMHCDGSGTTTEHPGGWAYILQTVHPVTGELVEKQNSGHAFNTTNNRMELTAAIEGLRAITRPSFVVVHSDSQYVIHAFTQNWIEKWERQRWVKIKNSDLWHLLIAESRRHMTSWQWVKGHSGITLNERCDKLAGAARKLAMTIEPPPEPPPAQGRLLPVH
ncbi:MAG: ribonuclease [Thermoleophilaceae bacterium]|jgi:ribonuclease HI|nr:ribonuclease [Thermoleophilaceae bacterium]